MNIRSIFEKSIDRNLKGVIKVGQEGNENVKQELEEYVVTRELQKHFATFSQTISKVLSVILIKWVYGSQVSLAVVNLIF